jgi:general secretion pathway protein A
MYCEYFGFSEKPFNITPDPNFLYMSSGHEEMLTSIIYGIQERRGLITIVGAVGTGKTTILNTALEWLSQKTKVAYVCNFNLNFRELLILVLYKLGLVAAGDKWSKVDALYCLNEFAHNQLLEGANVALIVDEAQNLSAKVMENLRLLSNIETPKHKLIQIVLCGQPELDTKLDQPELLQLKQRVSIRRYIKPLNEKETYEYIRHRLTIAEYKGTNLFDSRALNLIWNCSGGVPRKINVICDNSLVAAFRRNIKKIDEPIIEQAIKDLRWEHPENAVLTSEGIKIDVPIS